MNAKELVTEYIKNNNNSTFSSEEIGGMMARGGAVINRTPMTVTTAYLKREGKEIVVTETTVTTTNEIVDGKVVFGKVEKTTEVLRAAL